MLIHQPFVLVIAGGVFVVEIISVLIQRNWFKFTRYRYGQGRRVFAMAPLHHHYQKLGAYESKIVTRFYIMCIVCAVLALATYPVAFGQMTRLVTGLAPGDPKFQRKYYEFLRALFPDYPRPAIWTDGYYTTTVSGGPSTTNTALINARLGVLTLKQAWKQTVHVVKGPTSGRLIALQAQQQVLVNG